MAMEGGRSGRCGGVGFDLGGFRRIVSGPPPYLLVGGFLQLDDLIDQLWNPASLLSGVPAAPLGDQPLNGVVQFEVHHCMLLVLKGLPA